MLRIQAMNIENIKITAKCYELLLFKSIERLSRFHRHIRDINERHGKNYQAHTKELEHCLWIVLNKLCSNYKAYSDLTPEGSTKLIFEELFEVYSQFRKFHAQLIHLPRPSRPVEIIRFCRMLQKGLSGASNKGINIKMSVDIGELPTQEVYKRTPVEVLKTQLQAIFGSPETDALDTANNETSDCHLAIPRIEVKNSCVWATAAHEIGHVAIDQLYGEDSIVRDFHAFIGSTGLSIPTKFKDKELLKAHLVEYWCDFFGALAMSWSFWFSQIDSMFFIGLEYPSKSHPPSYLRLWVIKQILRSRISYKKDAALDTEATAESALLELIRSLDKAPFDNDDRLLAHLFLQYIFESLYKRGKDNTKNINENFEFLIQKFFQYSDTIENNTISELINSLEKGFPIPSVLKSNEEIYERATSVQEILLAAALSKGLHTKPLVLAEFKKLCLLDSLEILITEFVAKIDPIFDEFDLCVLKSLQVSEYVDILANSQEDREQKLKEDAENRSGQQSSILVDTAIYKILKSKELRAIPLIDLNQIGSTSLDIRLGTSFQVYYPNRSGVIDFTSKTTLQAAENNSFLIDLDLLDHFVLAPGNFILGHTMEYLSLPPTIAAEIEGRSSYARLGIEIHMAASFVDPGFHGVLTLEIFNAGPNPIKLFPGLRIGQLRFFECTIPSKHYGTNPHAKYKGLLSHRGSLHSNDPEISIYSSYIEKRLQTLKGTQGESA